MGVEVWVEEPDRDDVEVRRESTPDGFLRKNRLSE